MKRFLIFGVAALAAMALTVAPAIAGPSCSGHKATKTDAKLTSVKETCDAGDAAACAKKLGISKEECQALCKELGDNCDFTQISIKGMTCGGCESGVKTALMTAPGVRKVVRVSYKDELAVVAVDRAKFCEQTATKMITDQGYKAEIIPAVATTGVAAPAKMMGDKSACSKTCTSKEKAACAAKEKAAEKNKTDDAGGTF
ncbi:MAG: cation transporter [bacterium]|nr:cation transporter [bacterium]